MAGLSSSERLLCLSRHVGCDIVASMTTLAEIESAAAALSDAEKHQLMLFLAARLKAQASTPVETSLLSGESMTDWMAEDEAAMRRLHPGAQG
jgi:hypothetical protein